MLFPGLPHNLNPLLFSCKITPFREFVKFLLKKCSDFYKACTRAAFVPGTGPHKSHFPASTGTAGSGESERNAFFGTIIQFFGNSDVFFSKNMCHFIISV